MDELWHALLPHIIEAAVPLIGAVLSALAGLALNEVRRHFRSATADKVLTRLERATMLAVQDIEQTIGWELRQAAADGKITADEALMLRTAAIDRVKHILGTHGLRDVKATVGELEPLIDSIIEAKVHEVRTRASVIPGTLLTTDGDPAP